MSSSSLALDVASTEDEGDDDVALVDDGSFVRDPDAWRRTCDPEAWARATARKGDYFDEFAADHVCAFFPRYLKHTKGRWAGKPFELEPWQRSVLRAAFGWKKADGTRRFRIVYMEVARKNGKTALAAGIALYLAFCDGEAGAEVYCAAVAKKQAAICFNEASRMRGTCSYLKSRTDAFKFNISDAESFSKLEVIASDYGSLDGLNIHGVIGDEVHAWKNRALYDVLHTAEDAREQPMEFLITTAGVDEDTLWGDMRDRAEKVRDGELDDHEFLPILFVANDNDPIDDPRTWEKANPSIGVTKPYANLAKEAKRALQQPSYLNAFKRLHLNIPTRQTSLWIPLPKLDAGRRVPEGLAPTPSLEKFAGRAGWGGMDLAATSDFSALALHFPEFGDKIVDVDLPDGTKAKRRLADRVDAWWHFWLPRARVKDLSAKARQPIERWESQGWVTVTNGDVADYDRIRTDISGLPGRRDGWKDIVNIKEIGRDKWNATQITNQLMGDGLEMVDFGQGYASMSPAAKDIERLILGENFNDGGNPVFRWMASVVEVQQDAAENIKPVKPDRRKTGSRIDGVVASCIAQGRVSAAGVDTGTYNGRGLLFA